MALMRSVCTVVASLLLVLAVSWQSPPFLAGPVIHALAANVSTNTSTPSGTVPSTLSTTRAATQSASASWTSLASISASSLPTSSATSSASRLQSVTLTTPQTPSISRSVSAQPTQTTWSYILSSTISQAATASLSVHPTLSATRSWTPLLSATSTMSSSATQQPTLSLTATATTAATATSSHLSTATSTASATTANTMTRSMIVTPSVTATASSVASKTTSLPLTVSRSQTLSHRPTTTATQVLSLSLSRTGSSTVTSTQTRAVSISSTGTVSSPITQTSTLVISASTTTTRSQSTTSSVSVSTSMTATSSISRSISHTRSTTVTASQTATSSDGGGRTFSMSKSLSSSATATLSRSAGRPGGGGTLSSSVSVSVTVSISKSVSPATYSPTATHAVSVSTSMSATVSVSLQRLSLLEAGHSLVFSPFFQDADFQCKRVVMRRPPSVAHVPLAQSFRVMFSDDVMVQLFRTAKQFDFVDYGLGRRCEAEDFDRRWGAFDAASCRQPLTCWQTRVPQRDLYTFGLSFGPASKASSCATDSLMAEANVVIRGRFAPGPVYYDHVQLIKPNIDDSSPLPPSTVNSTIVLRNGTNTTEGLSVLLSHSAVFSEASPGVAPGSVQLCEIDDVLAFNGYGGVGNGETYTCRWVDPTDGSQRQCRTTAEYQTVCTGDLDCVGFSIGLDALAFAVAPPYPVAEQPLFLHRGDDTFTPDANVTKFRYGVGIYGHVYYSKPRQVNRTCSYSVRSEPQVVTVLLAQTSFSQSFAQVFYVNSAGQRQLAAECGARLPFAPRDASSNLPLFGKDDRCDEFVACTVSPPLPVGSTVEIVAGPMLDQRVCKSALRAIIQSAPVDRANGTAPANEKFFPTAKEMDIALPLVTTTASVGRATVIVREVTTLQLDVLQTAFLGAHNTAAVTVEINPALLFARVNTSDMNAPMIPPRATKRPKTSSSMNTTVVSLADLFNITTATTIPAVHSVMECGGSKSFGGSAGLGGQCESTLTCAGRPVEMSQTALAAFGSVLSTTQRSLLQSLALPTIVTADTLNDNAVTVFYSGPVVVSVDLAFMRGAFPLFTLPSTCIRFKATMSATQLPVDSVRTVFSHETAGVAAFPTAGTAPLVAVPAGSSLADIATPTGVGEEAVEGETLVLSRFGPDAKDLHFSNVSIQDALARRMDTVTLVPSSSPPGDFKDALENSSVMCVHAASSGRTDVCRVVVPLGANHVTIRIAQIDAASNSAAVRFLASPTAGAARTVQCGAEHGFQSQSGRGGECDRYCTCVASFIDANATGVIDIEVPFGHVAPIASSASILTAQGSAAPLGSRCAFSFAASVGFERRAIPDADISNREECHEKRQGLFCEDERLCLPLESVCDGRANQCASGADEDGCVHFRLVQRNTALLSSKVTPIRRVNDTANAMDCRRHAVIWSAEAFVYHSADQTCDLFDADAARLTLQIPDTLLVPGDGADLYMFLPDGPFSFRKCTAELHCSGFGQLLNPDAVPGDECLCECTPDRAGSDCSRPRTVGVAAAMYALVDRNATVVPSVLSDALSLGMRAVTVLTLGASLFNDSLAAVQFAPSSPDAEALARHQALMWATAGGPGKALDSINNIMSSFWQPTVRGLFSADGHHAFSALAQCTSNPSPASSGSLNFTCVTLQPRSVRQLMVRAQGLRSFQVSILTVLPSGNSDGSSSVPLVTADHQCSVTEGTAAVDGTEDCAATTCILPGTAGTSRRIAQVSITTSTVSACSATSAIVLATSDATLLSLSDPSASQQAVSASSSERRYTPAMSVQQQAELGRPGNVKDVSASADTIVKRELQTLAAEPAATTPARYATTPSDFIVSEKLDNGLFSAALGIGAVMLVTIVGVVAVTVLISRAFRAAQIVMHGANAMALRYLPTWVKITLVSEHVNQSWGRVMLYAALAVGGGVLLIGTLAGFFAILYAKSVTSTVGVSIVIDVYSTQQCGGTTANAAAGSVVTFPSRATSFSAVGTCSALSFTGLSEDALVGKGSCSADGTIEMALSRTITGCEGAVVASVPRGRCVPLKSLGLGAADPSVAFAVVECVSTALASDHVAGLQNVNPSGSLHTAVVPSRTTAIDKTREITAADGSTVYATPYQTGRVPGLATSHEKHTVASVHSTEYLEGAPDANRMVLQTGDSFLGLESQTQSMGNVTSSEGTDDNTLSLTGKHARRLAKPILAVLENGGASNDTVRAIAASTPITPTGIAADTKDLPVGHLFGGYGTSLELQSTDAASGAQRYFSVPDSNFDVGSSLDGSGVDGAATVQAWVRATETSRGVAVAVTDHFENTATKTSPVIEQLLLAVAAGDAASSLWFDKTWRVYSALVLDGPARRVSFMFADPDKTSERVVLAQWQLDELGHDVVFTSHEWHHLAVVVHRGLGKPFARLYIDGRTLLNSQLWRKCLPRTPPKVTDLPSVVKVTGTIEVQQAVATNGGVVYVGYGNMGVDAVSARGKTSDAGYFTRRGTRAMRIRNSMQTPSLLTLAAASFVGAMASLAALLLCIRTIRAQTDRLHTARRIEARQKFEKNAEKLFTSEFKFLSYTATREILQLEDGDEFSQFITELCDEPTDVDGSPRLVHCLWLASGGDGPLSSQIWDGQVLRHAHDVMLSIGKEEVFGGEITLDDDAAAGEAALGAGSGAAVALPPQLSAVFLAVLTTMQSMGVYMTSWDLPSTFGWAKSVIRIFTFDWILNLAENPLTTPLVLLFATLVTLGLVAVILARDVQRFRSHLLRYQFVRDRAEGVAMGLRDRALGILLAVVDAPFFRPGPPKATPKLHTTTNAEDGCPLVTLQCPLHPDRLLIPREQDKVFPFHGRYRCCIVTRKKADTDPAKSGTLSQRRPASSFTNRDRTKSRSVVVLDDVKVVESSGPPPPLGFSGRSNGSAENGAVEHHARTADSAAPLDVSKNRRSRSSANVLSPTGERLARCGDDQCLLLTCPQCDYAVCEAHARAPTYRRVLYDLWMLVRAYMLHGWMWFTEFIVLNIAISLYTPVLRTCVMIIGCHPQFQCVFPHCWRKVEQDYAAAVYLSAVVGVVFGLGFPFTLYFVIRGRMDVLTDVFGSVSYGGVFMAPFDKVLPIVKSDEAELEATGGVPPKGFVVPPSGNVVSGAVTSSRDAIANADGQNQNEGHDEGPSQSEIRDDPQSHEARCENAKENDRVAAVLARRPLVNPLSPPPEATTPEKAPVSDPEEQRPAPGAAAAPDSPNLLSLLPDGAGLDVTHRRRSFGLSGTSLTEHNDERIEAQQQRLRSRSLIFQHETEAAAIERYTKDMPDYLRREIRRTGGVYGTHYERTVAHWVRDIVVRPTMALALWRGVPLASASSSSTVTRRTPTPDVVPVEIVVRTHPPETELHAHSDVQEVKTDLFPVFHGSSFRAAEEDHSQEDDGPVEKEQPSAVAPSCLVPPTALAPRHHRSVVSVFSADTDRGPATPSDAVVARQTTAEETAVPVSVFDRDGDCLNADDDADDCGVGSSDDGEDVDGPCEAEHQETSPAMWNIAAGGVEGGSAFLTVPGPKASADRPWDTAPPVLHDVHDELNDSQASAQRKATDSGGQIDKDAPEMPLAIPQTTPPAAPLNSPSDGNPMALSQTLLTALREGRNADGRGENVVRPPQAARLIVPDTAISEMNAIEGQPAIDVALMEPTTPFADEPEPQHEIDSVPAADNRPIHEKITQEEQHTSPKNGNDEAVDDDDPPPLHEFPVTNVEEAPVRSAKKPARPNPEPASPSSLKSEPLSFSKCKSSRLTFRGAALLASLGRPRKPAQHQGRHGVNIPPIRRMVRAPVDCNVVAAADLEPVMSMDDPLGLMNARSVPAEAPVTAEDLIDESFDGRNESRSPNEAREVEPSEGDVAQLAGSQSWRAHDEESPHYTALPSLIVGDVVSLSLAEMAQVRDRRLESDFPTRWLESLHRTYEEENAACVEEREGTGGCKHGGGESTDGISKREKWRSRRREMAARRIQEFWRRDRRVLPLQRVIVETVLEYKAVIVLQRLYKSMLQRKLIAAIKRQGAMAKSHVVLTSEWLRFAKCDASILALVYQQLHFHRITAVPALLCGKFLFVIPTLLLEPQSVGQFIAVSVGEMVYAALFATFDPYLSPWVMVVTLLGSVQQLLLIATQISVVAVRNDKDISKPAGYVMACLTACYFSSIVVLLIFMVVQPAVRASFVDKTVSRLFRRFKMQRPKDATVYRYKHAVTDGAPRPGLEVDYRQQSHHWAIVPPKAAEVDDVM